MCEPTTHYGVFKRANEGNARVYYLDHGLNSVGLRPLTVYGVNRDTGLTSDPTKAKKLTAAKLASGEASLNTIVAAAPSDAPEETPSR